MPDFTGGQFPSLDGDAAAEVAQRTEPDTDGSWFRKVFTVHNRHHTRGLPSDHEFHLTNFASVLQSALQQGLHPKAAPELESEQDHPSDANSTNIEYKVQVVPAVADEHPETTVTPSNLAQVLADPDALQEAPAEPEPQSDRWERGEGGVDEHGAPLLPPQPLQETTEQGTETPSAPPAPEVPPAAPETPETPPAAPTE